MMWTMFGKMPKIDVFNVMPTKAKEQLLFLNIIFMIKDDVAIGSPLGPALV